MTRDDHMKWFHGRLTREAADELLKQGAYCNGAKGTRPKTANECVIQRVIYVCTVQGKGEEANCLINCNCINCTLIVVGYEDGTFLVRESSTAAGDFVLSLFCQVSASEKQQQQQVTIGII